MTRLLALFGGIPWTLFALAAVTAWGGLGHLKAYRTAAAFAEYIAAVEKAAGESEKHERLLEFQRVEAQKEVSHANALSRARDAAVARSDGLAAAHAEHGLRDAVAAARPSGAAGADPRAAAECQTAASAFADLFLACTSEYRQLADDAAGALGSARGAGYECEQSYDALTVKRLP